MGGGPQKDKKFIQKIMFQIANGEDELFIVNDKLGTPTYTHDFARNVRLLIEEGKTGLYNMVCQGVTSRLDVAQELVKQIGMNGTIKITEVSSNHFEKEYFALRPASERLINVRLSEEGLDIMKDWETALSEYLSKDYSDYLE